MQILNNRQLNECLNQIFIEDRDIEALRINIQSFDNIDRISLANNLEEFQNIEFWCIAAYIYKLNQQWKKLV